ncbi:TolB family protein [Bacteroidota bacterium]
MKNLIYLFAVLLLFSGCSNRNINKYSSINEEIEVFPDYKNIIIPVNIAPLNFLIKSEADEFMVQYVFNDEKYIPEIDKNKVVMPIKKWRKLMNRAVNDSIYVNIYKKGTSGWQKFNSFYWYVSEDSIDSYFSYRLIDPGYERWNKMGIYMQNIENFEQSTIFDNTLSGGGCMNCHEYNNRNPEEFMLHIRGNPGGTLVKTKETIKWLNTKTDFTMSAGVYPSWHPSGKYIAMSVNRIVQYFHNDPKMSIEVTDHASDLIVLDIDKNEITTSPKVSTKDNETMPVWDPKGEYIYFIKTAQWNDTMEITDIRFDLFRIKYDAESNTWGDVETVLEVSKIGKSITLPKFSPSGRYILYTMTDYGNFTIHHKDADLYMFDLKTKVYYPLSEANSDHVDSYHTWSSSSKWFLFSSKRLDGICSRPYISHVDENGKASKAFVIPQKDPEFYLKTTQSFNRPELMTGPVRIPAYKIRQLIYSEPELVSMDPSVELDALSGATKFSEEYRNKDAEPYMRSGN